MSALPSGHCGAERENLRRLLELLPERELGTVERVLEGLIALEHDPFLLALAEAPDDDEPEPEEEAEAVLRSREQAAQGEMIPDAELWRELGHEPHG